MAEESEAANGGLAGISAAYWDDDVRRGVSTDPRRFGRAENNTLDGAANGYTLFAASGAVYGTSLFFDSKRLHDFPLDMMSALTLEYPVVFTLKKAFHTERPNGKSDGFPSGHAAGAVTLAAMLGEHFGLIPGLAGYVFAGFVAFHRIDAGNHDLSDVIFGATLGYVFGKTVAETDELPVLHARLVPYGGDRVSGLALQWRF